MSRKTAADHRESDDVARATEDELRELRVELEKVSPAIKLHLQRLTAAARRGKSGMPTPGEVPALLVDLYSYAAPADRRLILTVGMRRLSTIAAEATHSRTAAAHEEMLYAIGASFQPLVLEGTVYQQLVSAFAVQLGSLAPGELARVRAAVVTPLVDALVTLLRVGAPNTRDSAVEGLGALLKGAGGDAEKETPFQNLVPQLKDGASKIAQQYVARLTRRRTMSLTVAGHKEAHRQFVDSLRERIASVIADVRRKGGDTLLDDLQTALYERADLLRTLPALLRQGGVDIDDATGFLRDAAQLPPMREDEGEAVAVAFARFQESVFRTIDVVIKREPKWLSLDQSIADAVLSIPATVVGPPALCNHQIRATIAILQAATRFIEHDFDGSLTKSALSPLFRGLRQKPAPWLNLGLAEGCYRGLPFLLSNAAHDDLVRPALNALFKHLHRHHDPHDFAETHRQLIANACFRRILIRRMEVATEIAVRTGNTDEQSVEHDVRALRCSSGLTRSTSSTSSAAGSPCRTPDGRRTVASPRRSLAVWHSRAISCGEAPPCSGSGRTARPSTA